MHHTSPPGSLLSSYAGPPLQTRMRLMQRAPGDVLWSTAVDTLISGEPFVGVTLKAGIEYAVLACVQVPVALPPGLYPMTLERPQELCALDPSR